MKLTAILVITLLLASCGSKQEKKTEPEIEDVVEEVYLNSTAYEYPEFNLPENFYLDSIYTYDSLSRASYSAYYLQSSLKDMTTFNSLMKADAWAQITKVQEFVDPYNEAFGDFEVIFSFGLRPISFFSDDNVISIRHIIDEYTEGAAHHNHTSYSFNYNLNKKQKMHFSDVFNLRTSADSLQFITTAEQRVIDGGCSSGWGSPHDVDFSFGDEGIYIDPNLGWACSGTRSLFPWDEFRGSKDKTVIEPSEI